MSLQIQENIPLNAHTTLHIGGVARYFVEVTSVDAVYEAIEFAEERSLPILILGGGSNMLINDDGFSGLVIKNCITGFEVLPEEGGVTIIGGSGEVFDEVVEKIVAMGYVGIENLSSIPGTLGATPVQNVGAYGVEIGDLVASVTAIHLESRELKIFSHDECMFAYRDSFFKSVEGKKYFITQVTLCLKKNNSIKISYADLQKFFSESEPSVQEVRDAVIKIRAGKFPDWRVLGTAGSFFKNPIITAVQYEELCGLYPELPHYAAQSGMVKIPLGYVLDRVCGLKGYRLGAVGLYEAQALVLVNYGNATAAEVKTFVEIISKKVFEKTKIKIEPEVNFI